MPTGAKLKHNGSRVFPARTALAPTTPLRKDGTHLVPLAHEPPFDEVLCIRTFRPRAEHRPIARTSQLSPECWACYLGATSGCAKSNTKYNNSNCWRRSFGRTLRARSARRERPSAGLELRPAALPCFPRLPTTTPCVPRAEPVRYLPPN